MKTHRITKERKELSVGPTREESVSGFVPFDESRHECIHDEQTALWQVFHRRKQIDRTIRKPISRETRLPFRHYRRVIVITLLPNDLISFRLKGTKTRTFVEIEKVYAAALQWQAFAAMAKRRSEKLARRKARQAMRA